MAEKRPKAAAARAAGRWRRSEATGEPEVPAAAEVPPWAAILG